ncbi:amidase [Labedella populi]|uniref:Amidase n=1 Tax=Labedella populi TaxID=2498850 RepID=A0A3S4AB25_9MICO|nr:amidase [Labedella populi]RWZ64451.1 amidase [Labedella populi]
MKASTTTRLGALAAADIVAGYREGAFTPVDVARDVIDAVEARNEELNVFASYAPAEVVADAEASAGRWAAGAELGPLDGVPVTVKENMHRRGVAYRSGTAAGTPEFPVSDNPAVERLLEAGAVIVGSTTMPDWGMLSSGVSSLHGITRSPWNPAWTVGGSSGGAGAAAAAGFGPIHIGSDIGGSVRLPATWAGLVALKPSDGRIPHDTPYFGRSLGPLGRTVADVALAMTAVARPDWRDYTSLPAEDVPWTALDGEVRGLRVALQLDPGAGMAVDPEVTASVRAAADLFASAGAEVVELAPALTPEMLDAVDLFWRVRFWNTYSKLSVADRQRVLPFIVQWCSGGADVAGRRVLEAYDTIQSMRAETVAATQPFDLVLSPVSPVAAFPAEWPMPFGDDDEGMAHIAYCVPYNMTGQPASSINSGFTRDGRTIGLQIAGRRHDDLGVLRATAWFESARPEAARPVFPIR